MSELVIGENNELVLVGKPKTRKERKKVKEEGEKFFPSFFTEDQFRFSMSRHGLLDSTNVILSKVNKINPLVLEEWIPFFAINFKTTEGLPIYDYAALLQGEDNIEKIKGEKSPEEIKERYNNLFDNIRFSRALTPFPKVRDYFKNIWNSKDFAQLLWLYPRMGNHEINSDLTKIQKYLENKYNIFLNPDNTNYNLHIPTSVVISTATRIMNKCKFETTFKCSTLAVPNSTWTSHPKYITNLFFLGRLDCTSADYSFRSIKPLFCLMVKKENLEEVKALFINNMPIPAKYFQFWVDQSIENEDKVNDVLVEPSSTGYKKHIKSFIKKTGIETVQFDNLEKQLFLTAKLKKFNTFAERNKFIGEIMRNTMESILLTGRG